MGILGIIRSTLDVLWFSYFAKIEQKWHLPKLLYGLPRKKMTLSLKRVGILGNWGKFAKSKRNTAPQGAHILLGVLSKNIRGWGGIPRPEKEKNEENH